MLELREIASRTEPEWDQHVLTSPRGMLFHLTDWLRIVADCQHLRLIRLGIFDKNDLVGVFPLFVKRFGFLTVVGSPFVVEDTHYLGPVVEDRFLPEVMHRFVEYMSAHRIRYARVILRHDSPREPFSALGYECIDNLTHVVDLRLDQESLWKRLKPPCQRQIRKATRLGVTTEVVRHDRYLDAYYRLVMHMYAHQGRTPPVPQEFFRAMWDRFGTVGDLVWVLAKHEGELAAGALLALWKDTAYYLDGVSDRQRSGLGASNALHWAAMQWAKSEGYAFYDFVGSNVPRFFQFKSSFGGELTTYLSLEMSRPACVRALRQRYASYKAVLQRLKLLREQVQRGKLWPRTSAP